MKKALREDASTARWLRRSQKFRPAADPFPGHGTAKS